jgi:hypothetical protein
MTLHLPDWPPLAAGDRVLIRDRTTALERITTVANLLHDAEGEGPGFVDDDGATIRHFYFTASPVARRSEHPLQADVDKIFCELTGPQTHIGSTLSR